MATPRKVHCNILAIVDHGHHVYTIDLKPLGNVPHFRPGQFLHLTVEEYEPSGFWPESRVFSIVSSPETRDKLRICYSVVGKYTRRMEEVLTVGGSVWVKLPYGEFEIAPGVDAVLLAGGTGIGAFMAFLETLKPSWAQEVHLFYGVRHPGLLLYAKEIGESLSRYPKGHFSCFCETGMPDSSKNEDQTQKQKWFPGRLDLEVIWSNLAHPHQKVFYLSGPPEMIHSLKNGLEQRGFSQDRIRTDAWE